MVVVLMTYQSSVDHDGRQIPQRIAIAGPMSSAHGRVQHPYEQRYACPSGFRASWYGAGQREKEFRWA